jgi:hypothetical protein
VHDVKLLEPTLDQVVVARPEPSAENPQHLCADAAYKGEPAMDVVVARNYQPHIKQRREEADAKRPSRVTRPAAGRWNEPIPGSIASANCW